MTMKIKKEFIILIFIIVVLSVFLMFQKTDKTYYTLPELPEIAREDITRLTIKKEGSELTLERTNDRWHRENVCIDFLKSLSEL